MKNSEMMEKRFRQYVDSGFFADKKIFLFGHCNATEEMADMILDNGYEIEGILDNNANKWGIDCKGACICKPQEILSYANAVVCIASRFYEEMYRQLREIGFRGRVLKLADFNTYAEYSLSEDTVSRKQERLRFGCISLKKLGTKYPGFFRIFCPFDALGDVYMMMSYLHAFLSKINRSHALVIVPSRACAEVVGLFSGYKSEVMEQDDLDAAVQAVLYTKDTDSFVAHQDRPYVIDISRMLYAKCIPLDELYCSGIFGLPKGTYAALPDQWSEYKALDRIPKGKSVILSPYAKSVTALSSELWEDIVSYYSNRGYMLFTNVVGNEEPLKGTESISPGIPELKSVVEQTGLFIGIRSGLCDVISSVNAKKVALYPDYYYSNTKWKAIDMYRLHDFENIVVGEDFTWQGI